MKKIDVKKFIKLANKVRKNEENYPIKKLQPYRKYKVPTLNNKINEIIEYINSHEKNL